MVFIFYVNSPSLAGRLHPLTPGGTSILRKIQHTSAASLAAHPVFGANVLFWAGRQTGAFLEKKVSPTCDSSPRRQWTCFVRGSSAQVQVTSSNHTGAALPYRSICRIGKRPMIWACHANPGSVM